MKKWLCIICGLIYDEAKGWPSDGIAPGTTWENVPEDWVCPDCLVGKADFEMIEVTDEEITAISLQVSAEVPLQQKDVEVTKASYFDAPIIIIGSGHSGYQLAAALRAKSSAISIIVFTADDGALYSKPALSNAFSMGKDSEMLKNESALAWEERLNIRVYPNTKVNHIDRENMTVNTNIGDCKYSRLVVATGASAIDLSIKGSCSNLFSINNLEDYRAFRSQLVGKKRVAILGDGLIGCEFANDLIENGYEVTVIGLGKWPMERLLPQQLGLSLQAALASLGVSWCLQDSISKIEHTATSASTLYLESGKIIEADIVLSAVGLTPNVNLARQAGLDIGRGIKVNHYGQTSDQFIFSLGDCCETESGWLPYISPINQMIPALAESLLGQLTKIALKPAPILVKTPVIPLSMFPVHPAQEGNWHIELEGDEYKAAFYSPNGQLLGFVLLGKQVQLQRQNWLEQLSLNKSTVL